MPLSSMDFPLDIKICFQPARFNETVLKSFGYEGMHYYLTGWSNYNDSHALIGWGGNQSSRVKDAGEILHAAKYDWTKGCPKKSFLRILLKQDTALLSHVRVLVRHRRDISSFLDNLIV